MRGDDERQDYKHGETVDDKCIKPEIELVEGADLSEHGDGLGNAELTIWAGKALIELSSDRRATAFRLRIFRLHAKNRARNILFIFSAKESMHQNG